MATQEEKLFAQIAEVSKGITDLMGSHEMWDWMMASASPTRRDRVREGLRVAYQQLAWCQRELIQRPTGSGYDSCPCGMPRKPVEGEPEPFTPEWHAEHERRHLAAFPDLDGISKDNLRSFVTGRL